MFLKLYTFLNLIAKQILREQQSSLHIGFALCNVKEIVDFFL